MSSASEKYFERALDNKTSEAQRAVEDCIRQFMDASSTSRQQSAQNACTIVAAMLEMLHPGDRPAWLQSLHQNLIAAHTHHGNTRGVAAMYGIATELHPALMKHRWQLDPAVKSLGVDFDMIYQKCRAESRLSDLFDETISLLKQLVESKQIDSIRLIDELTRVIDTLRAARRGTYFATHGAAVFVATWLKNTGWEFLGELPGMGSVVKGLRKTLEDMDAEMRRVDEAVHEECGRQVAAGFPRIENTNLRLLEFLESEDGSE